MSAEPVAGVMVGLPLDAQQDSVDPPAYFGLHHDLVNEADCVGMGLECQPYKFQVAEDDVTEETTPFGGPQSEVFVLV